MVIVKKVRDQKLGINEYCGAFNDVLTCDDSPNLTIALAFDVRPTIGHYHLVFQEVYFVLDGNLTMEFYDPHTKKTWQEKLNTNELCSIGPKIHHRIIEASEKNRLTLICAPAWSAADEYPSTVLK